MEAEKLSVTEFLSRIKVGQLWGVLVIVVGLVTGAFAVGYKAASAITEGKITTKESELAAKDTEITNRNVTIDDLNTKLLLIQSENEKLKDKDRFLSLYLRYEISINDGKYDNEDHDTREAFDEYITERVNKERLRLNKGSRRYATVKFEDGTIWELPREMHSVTKK